MDHFQNQKIITKDSKIKIDYTLKLKSCAQNLSLHTRVLPHHSGAHRSDTPTLLHSFGRHPNPPRAYALHQERSKQQGKRRGSVREINFAPPSAFIFFFPSSSSSSTSQAAPCLARNRRPAGIVPRRAESKYSRNRRGKSVVSLGFIAENEKDETKKRREFSQLVMCFFS